MYVTLILLICHHFVRFQSFSVYICSIYCLYSLLKDVRILKKEPERGHPPTRCQQHLNFCTVLELLRNLSKSLRAAEKSQGAAEKNKEKVEANWTGFSAEFFGSQSVEMFCFS